MESLGEIAKKRREEKKLSIEEISEKIKISSYFLKKIEENDFQKLPKAYFRKAIIKEYLKILDLPADELIKKFESQIYPEKEPEVSDSNYEESRKNVFSYIIAPIVIVVLIVLLVLLFNLKTKNSIKKEKFKNSNFYNKITVKKNTHGTAQIPGEKPSKNNSSLKEKNLQPEKKTALNAQFSYLSLIGECWLEVKRDSNIIISGLFLSKKTIKIEIGDEIIVGAPQNVEIFFNQKVYRFSGKSGVPIKFVFNEKSIGRYFVEK